MTPDDPRIRNEDVDREVLRTLARWLRKHDCPGFVVDADQERAEQLVARLVDGEWHDEIEVQTPGLRYPCSGMPAAWREFGRLKADGYDAKIVKRSVFVTPWTEVSE